MGTRMIPKCAHCGDGNVKLRRVIACNGVAQVRWHCLDCNRCAELPFRSIPYSEAQQIMEKHGKCLNDIPKVQPHATIPCMICGEPAEMHHWAPVALQKHFGDDWRDWPVGELCQRHHNLWHQIVTPRLPKGGD